MTAHLPEHSELTVVGGGPVGATVALLAAQAGRQVTLLEARPSGSGRRDDPRVLALSHTSQQALLAAGAWPDSLPATPIDTVHISQQGSFGRTLNQRDDLKLPHLGYTVSYPDLNQALDAALAASSVRVIHGAEVQGLHSLSAYAQVRFAHQGHTRQMTGRLVALAEGGALAAQLPGMRRHARRGGLADLACDRGWRHRCGAIPCLRLECALAGRRGARAAVHRALPFPRGAPLRGRSAWPPPCAAGRWRDGVVVRQPRRARAALADRVASQPGMSEPLRARLRSRGQVHAAIVRA